MSSSVSRNWCCCEYIFSKEVAELELWEIGRDVPVHDGTGFVRGIANHAV